LFDRGSLTVLGFEDGCREVEIAFQNENLIATDIKSKSKDKKSKVLATVPHLIVIVDCESGFCVQTEDLKYGLAPQSQRRRPPSAQGTPSSRVA
jgi:DUF917 family protein